MRRRSLVVIRAMASRQARRCGLVDREQLVRHGPSLSAGVVRDDHALAGCDATGELELGQRGGALEQPRAAAQGQRVDQQRVIVDRAGGVQASYQRRAAVDR